MPLESLQPGKRLSVQRMSVETGEKKPEDFFDFKEMVPKDRMRKVYGWMAGSHEELLADGVPHKEIYELIGSAGILRKYFPKKNMPINIYPNFKQFLKIRVDNERKAGGIGDVLSELEYVQQFFPEEQEWINQEINAGREWVEGQLDEAIYRGKQKKYLDIIQSLRILNIEIFNDLVLDQDIFTSIRKEEIKELLANGHIIYAANLAIALRIILPEEFNKITEKEEIIQRLALKIGKDKKEKVSIQATTKLIQDMERLNLLTADELEFTDRGAIGVSKREKKVSPRPVIKQY